MASNIGVKGKQYKSQTLEVIGNVIAFMKLGENGLQIPLSSFRERVIAATGISKHTYSKALKEKENIEINASTSYSSPPKKKPKKSTKADVPGELAVIRQIIYNSYIIEKSLNSILQSIREAKVAFHGGHTTLRKLLRNMGFRWKKTEDNRAALMETHDIRYKRVQYLRKIIHYRQQGRPTIYIDETYINSSHTQSKDWIDTMHPELVLKKPIGKGRRLIIVHAGGENGFIENGLLIFRSGSKSGDYHSDMNHENFMKWICNHLIPNLPSNSVLVVDNASYHNVKTENNITSSTKKADMKTWLNDHSIEYEETMNKAELYYIIKQNKEKYFKYALDFEVEKYGHEVCQLPPYHPDLNPIEKMGFSKKLGSYQKYNFQTGGSPKVSRRKI